MEARPRARSAWRRAPWALPILLLLAGCATEQSALDPRGPEAESIAGLWWIMLALGTAVWVVMLAALAVAVLRRPRDRDRDPLRERRSIVALGVLGPAVILVVLFALALKTTRDVVGASPGENLTVEVVGHLWWWEVRYPDQGIVTANEIHIPTGQDVEVRLSSTDVIHSLWVPNLGGKVDLVPGQTNTMRLHAEEPGTYRGQCAEYCGLQHANMAFVVVAEEQAAFDRWLAGRQEPPPPPQTATAQRGQEVFLSGTCVYCHTVEGTDATGKVGPDLTRIGSRRTLGAGTVPNNRGNLAGWIIDPQSIKPGNLMPPTTMTGEELQALLDYLQTLR